MSILSIPTIITEQYPKGLGKTVIELINSVENGTPIVEKTSFSALKEENFKSLFNTTAKKQILLCGIETHICVLQTALELLREGYEVFIIEDCCSSRFEKEHQTAIQLMKQYDIKILSTEIVLFELLKSSKHEKFKEIQALIK